MAATTIGTDVVSKLEQSVDKLTKRVWHDAKELIESELAKLVKPREIVIRDLKTNRKTKIGRTHESFAEALLYIRMGLNVMLVGPAGCLRGDTPIHDPISGLTSTIAERHAQGSAFCVWSLSRDGAIVVARAERPCKYPAAAMIRLSFASGRRICVTKAHRFWNGRDYVSGEQILRRLRECAYIHLPTISVDDLSTRTLDVQRLTRTTAGYRDRCSLDYRRRDGQLPGVEGVGQFSVRKQDDAQRRIPQLLRTDEMGNICTNTFRASSDRRATPSCLRQSELSIENEWKCRHLSGPRGYNGDESSVDGPRRRRTTLGRIVQLLFGGVESTIRPFGNSLLDLGPPDCIGYDRIVKAEEIGCEPYYDFHVPVHENYWAVGNFHHNCGKTWMCGQLAEAMGLRFGHISGSTGVTESQLLGRAVPNITTGKDVYCISPFIDFVEEGGLWLHDEFDAFDPNVQVSLNAGLSDGGKFSVPNRMDNPTATRHKDFVCILACNTFGDGPDRMYVGRNPMDATTKDRFVVIEMKYDRELERELVTAILGSADFAERMWRIRDNVQEARMERVVSTRMIERAATILKGLETDDFGAEMTDPQRIEFVLEVITRGWDVDDVRVALA